MNLTPIKTLAQNAMNELSKRSPEILAGAAICGVVTTTVLAIKATPKAVMLLEKNQVNRPKKISRNYVWKVIKTTWKCYIPTVISGGITIAAIIASNRISTKRAAILAGLYSMSEKALAEYKAKTEEVVGRNKATKIHDELMADKLKENPAPKDEDIPGQGSTKCFDTFSGRYFWSDIETLRRIQAEINLQIMDNVTASVNDLYYMIGSGQLEPIKWGNEMGWTIQHQLQMKFTSKLTDNGEPVLVVDFSVDPTTFYPADGIPW